MKTIEIKREPITQELRDKVLARDNYTCRYCGSNVGPFHLDHVYPVVKGGETSMNNLVTSCKHCNAKKHSSVGIWPNPIGYFSEKLKSNPHLLTGLILTGGVLFLAINVQVIISGHDSMNRIALMIGFLLCSLGLGRVLTGK